MHHFRPALTPVLPRRVTPLGVTKTPFRYGVPCSRQPLEWVPPAPLKACVEIAMVVCSNLHRMSTMKGLIVHVSGGACLLVN